MAMLVPYTMNHIVENYQSYIYCLALSMLLLVVINKLFFKIAVTGLLGFQISFVFNFAIILYGLFYNFLSIERFLHFISYELFVAAGVYYIYARILNNRKFILRFRS